MHLAFSGKSTDTPVAPINPLNYVNFIRCLRLTLAGHQPVFHADGETLIVEMCDPRSRGVRDLKELSSCFK